MVSHHILYMYCNGADTCTCVYTWREEGCVWGRGEGLQRRSQGGREECEGAGQGCGHCAHMREGREQMLGGEEMGDE